MIIAGRTIGPDHPPAIIAEISANHNGSLERAFNLIDAAKLAGADFVKFQAYEADTITINCDGSEFILEDGPWQGRKLYDLYRQAQTPLAWFPALVDHANKTGIYWLSSVFDKTSIDLLDGLGCPAFKIASMEIVDLPLIRYAASKGKPLIISTGMASNSEIMDAVTAARHCVPAILHCVSGYPTPIEEAGLHNIERLRELVGGGGRPIGISDHSHSLTVSTNTIPIAATAMGACIIEKHLDRYGNDGIDAEFSLDPGEFRQMVMDVRATWEAMQPREPTSEAASRQLRRSLYVVMDMKSGDTFTDANVRSIRPAYGMAPNLITEVLGKTARQDIARGTPLSFELIGPSQRHPAP